MSVTFGVVIPPWALSGGAGELPERILGEVGVDYVVIPVVTGPLVRFVAASDEPYYASDAGWHFPPDSKLYQPVGVRPARRGGSAAVPGTTDLVTPLVKLVRNCGPGLVFRLDLRRAADGLGVSTSLAQRNAWGQLMPLAGACISSPPLTELLRATATDLRRYGEADIELLEWRLDQSVAPAEMRPFHWWPAPGRLIEVCFCPSCRSIAEQAGAEPDQAARGVRRQVDQLLRTGAAPADDDALLSYCRFRHQAARGALERLAQRLAPAAVRTVVDELDKLGDAPDRLRTIFRARTWTDLGAALAAQGGLKRLAVAAWRPLFEAAPDLVRFVQDGVANGVQDILFEGVEEAPPEVATWIKQAVRFARRA